MTGFLAFLKNEKFLSLCFCFFIALGGFLSSKLKQDFLISKENSEKIYFKAVVPQKFNITDVQKSLVVLPGVKEIQIEENVGGIKNKLEKYSEGLSEDILNIDFNGLTVFLDINLPSRSQEIITKYLLKLTESQATISAVKSSLNKSSINLNFDNLKNMKIRFNYISNFLIFMTLFLLFYKFVKFKKVLKYYQRNVTSSDVFFIGVFFIPILLFVNWPFPENTTIFSLAINTTLILLMYLLKKLLRSKIIV